MSDWQPIETAPKDGTPVLMIEDGRQFVAQWSTCCGWCNGEDGILMPDYWMPLPNPPTK